MSLSMTSVPATDFYGTNYHKVRILIISARGRWAFVLYCRSRHPEKWSHANQASPIPALQTLHPDQYLITVDLGTDSLHVYDLIEEEKLSLINQYQTAPWRKDLDHLVFHPHYKTAYLINELSLQRRCGSSTMEWENSEHFQTVSTLPSDYES